MPKKNYIVIYHQKLVLMIYQLTTQLGSPSILLKIKAWEPSDLQGLITQLLVTAIVSPCTNILNRHFLWCSGGFPIPQQHPRSEQGGALGRRRTALTGEVKREAAAPTHVYSQIDPLQKGAYIWIPKNSVSTCTPLDED